MGTDLFTYFSFVGNFRFVAKWDRRCRSSGTYDLQWTSEVRLSPLACGTCCCLPVESVRKSYTVAHPAAVAELLGVGKPHTPGVSVVGVLVV